MKILIILAVFCLSMFATEYDKGLSAYENKDFKQAFEYFKQAAKQGEVKAISKVGIMYYKGKGVKKDFMQASRWLEKAADMGDVLAQRSLGAFYANDETQARDYDKAIGWLERAADQGDELAVRNIETIKTYKR